MEMSPEVVTPTEVSGCGGSLQQERPMVRRRMVQSTLFPHKSPENATKKVVEIGDQQDRDEDEEYCSSQGKKKRGRKPKAAAKKVALDGRETSSRKVDDKESPVTDKSTLCTKASNGGHQQKDQPLFGSPGKEDEIEASSPLQSTPNMKSRRQLKKQASSTPKKRVRTPKKNTMNGGQKDICAVKISDPSSQGEAVIQPIPDLRLEEKLKAEEIARVFGGKEIHPFFSSCKIAKKTQQQTKDMDMNGCFVDGKDRSSILGPIHVFEKAQDDAASLDWGSWVLSEKSLVSINCDMGTGSSPVFDRSVNSLSFDDSLKLYPSGGTSLFQSEAIQHESFSLDQSLITMSAPMLSTDDSEAQYLFKKAQEHCHSHESESANISCEYAGYLRSTDSECGDGFLHKRTTVGNQGCGDHSENNLWTYRHLPEKANEVCGNGESVSFLSEWLHLWHERGFRSSKDHTAGKTFIVEDDDCNSYQSDSDPESRDEDDSLKNVLLLTGPVGSGKSAAIYACAKEQGFHVIEVNASDWRTRSLMMQRFGGGVESHCVQRTVEPPLGSESRRTLKPVAVISDTINVEACDSEVIELIPLSDDEYSLTATGIVERSVCSLSTSATNKNGSKPLILFEDVDAILSEDHGLIATIQKLAATAKRPIILTSNSQNSILPNNFDRIELCFTRPSLKELLSQVHMVCSAEKAKVQSILVERFINCCQGDLRKTIMNLQFWCQGQTSRQDKERRYDPLLFDIDSGHRILPNIISWGYPSPLSQFVDKEITQSLLMLEESSKLMDVLKEEDPNMKRRQRGSKRLKSKGNSIEEKKEAIIRTHCLVEDDDEFATQLNIPCDASPDTFMPRNVRRRLGTVLSSDSEDENVNNTFRVVRSLLFNDSDNEMAVDSTAPSYCPETELYIDSVREHLLGSEEKLEESVNLLTEQLHDSKEDKGQEDCSRCSEATVYTQIDVIHKPINMFSAPETSFVPETEIHGETSLLCRTVSCGHDADMTEIESTSNGLPQNVQPLWTNNLDEYFPGLDKNPEIIENSDICTVSAQREEVGDSHNGHLQAVPRGYQVMDECSRMDFNRGANSLMVMNSLQETWRKIRNCTDLKQYITPEERDASLVLRFTSGMSSLISEADVLLADCEPLARDVLEPSAVPSEKSHSFSWYDDQSWMTSAIAQHGISLYAKEIATVESKYGPVNRTNLSWEMLSSSTSTMALGKLVRQDGKIKSLDEVPLGSVISMRREPDSHLCSVLRSIVPPKLHLAAVKGDACYEYLSTLCQISRSEVSRLSEGISNTNQRRRRVAKNYLANGAMMLSPDDISLLGQYNSYGMVSPQSTDVSLK